MGSSSTTGEDEGSERECAAGHSEMGRLAFDAADAVDPYPKTRAGAGANALCRGGAGAGERTGRPSIESGCRVVWKLL